MSDAFDVLYTDEAERDIEAIHAYIATNGSLEAADRLALAIIDRIATLEEYPYRGTIPRELDGTGFTEFRQVVVGSYRLIYRTVDKTVNVTLIVDGRRDVASVLSERLVRS